MTVRCFDMDEDFLARATSSPNSYVLNVARNQDANSIVLHRASCGTLRAKHAPGALTTRSSRKIGAPAVNALATWIAANISPGAGFRRRCGNCRP